MTMTGVSISTQSQAYKQYIRTCTYDGTSTNLNVQESEDEVSLYLDIDYCLHYQKWIPFTTTQVEG